MIKLYRKFTIFLIYFRLQNTTRHRMMNSRNFLLEGFILNLKNVALSFMKHQLIFEYKV